MFGETVGTFTSFGQTAVADVTIPIGVIKGTVTYSDTTPVPFPNVFVTQRDVNGNLRSYFTNTNNPDGTYTVIGPQAGDFTLTAQDNNSGLTQVTTGNLSDVHVPVVVDVTMPPTGSVTGTVFDASGNPAPFADVAMANEGLNRNSFTRTDSNGNYQFNHAPLGQFSLQAVDNNFMVFVSARGRLISSGDTVVLNLVLPASGSVSGTVFAADSVTPIPNTTVWIENLDSTGPEGFSSNRVFTNASGNYSMEGVPVGTIRIASADPNIPGASGFATGQIAAGQNTIVNVVFGHGFDFFGNFFPFTFNLDGTNGFRYDVDCDGEIDRGGRIDGSLSQGYEGAENFMFNSTNFNESFPCMSGADTNLGGRGVVMGPAGLSGLVVTRKIYSPAGGGFTRYLDVIANPTQQAQQVTPLIQSFLNNSLTFPVVPADTGNTYAVTGNTFCCTPLLAAVFAGPGAPVPASDFQFSTAQRWVSYDWPLTVPPGESVILMHFEAQRDPTDLAAIQAQAQALVNQTDPDEFTGMTDDDKARVVNFNLTNQTVVPGTAVVSVTALMSDGINPLVGAEIILNAGGAQRVAGFTDNSGTLSIPNVPVGNFIVTAYKNGFVGEASGVVQAADAGSIVHITINSGITGTIQGHVFAADGLTPVQATQVVVLDLATGMQLAFGGTDANGFYQFRNIGSGPLGFKVRAISILNPLVTGENSGSFAVNGDVVTLNLQLNLSVVRGTVSYSDGTVVQFPTVVISQTDAAGNVTTFLPQTDVNGNFGLLGLPAGTFTLYAQDSNTGISSTSTLTLASISQPEVINVILQSGTVTGIVRDSNGNPAPFTQVAIASLLNGFNQFNSTDSFGVYKFTRVPLGSFTVQAVFFNGNETFASADGVLATDGQVFNADITMPATGTVFGTIFSSDGITPATNPTVSVIGLDSVGPEGTFNRQTGADTLGNYQINGVQVGAVQVAADTSFSASPSAPTVLGPVSGAGSVGVATGVLTTDSPLNLNITLGNGFSFRQIGIADLDGLDTFRYDVTCDGQLNDGGTTDRRFNDAYDDTYQLSLSTGAFSRQFPCLSAATLDSTGREVTLGPIPMAGLQVSRRIFSPDAGGFARYLDVMQNTGTTPVVASLLISGNLGSDNSTRVVVSPLQTGFTYAATDQSGICCDPLLAHVFAGTTSTLPTPAVQFVTGNDNIFYRFDNLTIAPGQTVIVMHFAVQHDPADLPGTKAQAESLANLTDPNVLTGMSAADKAAVANFVIP